MWNLKRKDTNGLTYKTGRLTDLEYELMVAGRRGYLGSSGGHVHTAIFKMDNQQAHGTLLSVMWQPGWDWGLGKNGYLFMYG